MPEAHTTPDDDPMRTTCPSCHGEGAIVTIGGSRNTCEECLGTGHTGSPFDQREPITQTTLKPCPFCGKQPEVFPSGDGSGTMIECTTPKCVNPHTSWYGENVAESFWNKRTS